MGTDYRKKAEELLAGQMAKARAGVEAQKNIMERNYADQLQTNQTNGALGQNIVANNNLGRGMGRSSIVTSQLASEAGKTANMENKILANKGVDMNNLEMQRAAMETDNQSNILSMMDQLKQRDEAAYRSSQAANSKASLDAAMKATWNEFYKAFDNNQSFEFTDKNREYIVNTFGKDMYEEMLDRASRNKYKEDKINRAKTVNSTPAFAPAFTPN